MRKNRVYINWRYLGFGIYINTEPYRYFAIQFGPAWIYLYAQKGLLVSKPLDK